MTANYLRCSYNVLQSFRVDSALKFQGQLVYYTGSRISSVCATYTVQHFDFTTFPLLFIVKGIINKKNHSLHLIS